MAIEIERKFLLANDAWRQSISTSSAMAQGYLNDYRQANASIRIRISGDKAHLNLKSVELGIQRLEYEYPVPVAEAEEMLERLCLGPIIRKTRHFVPVAPNLVWEIDEFQGDNAGLVVAEIELPSVDYPLELPTWIGDEVSDDPRYYNVNLLKHPYSTW